MEKTLEFAFNINGKEVSKEEFKEFYMRALDALIDKTQNKKSCLFKNIIYQSEPTNWSLLAGVAVMILSWLMIREIFSDEMFNIGMIIIALMAGGIILLFVINSVSLYRTMLRFRRIIGEAGEEKDFVPIIYYEA